MATVLSGAMSSLYRDFKDRVDFLYVYVLEAHPREGWRVGSDFSSIGYHKNLDERIVAARLLIEADEKFQTFTTEISDSSKFRLVADPMDNVFAETYAALPDRSYVIEGDKLAFIGATIKQLCESPHRLMTDWLRDWLEARFAMKT
ncbi:type I iodothyronine deiodinase-like [Ptychodera flava]|uniref:type I iodothyronine deiodinase-like n=1 Tax=Ptychodera flava TaxID=63121 RepID=UPI00396A51F7